MVVVVVVVVVKDDWQHGLRVAMLTSLLLRLLSAPLQLEAIAWFSKKNKGNPKTSQWLHTLALRLLPLLPLLPLLLLCVRVCVCACVCVFVSSNKSWGDAWCVHVFICTRTVRFTAPRA